MIKIRFDNTYTSTRSNIILCFCFYIFLLIYFYDLCVRRLHDCKSSILESQGLEVPSYSITFLCHLPDDGCICSATMNNSNTSENCITPIEYLLSPQLLLPLYIIEIIIIKKIFSLSGSYRSIVISILRVLSVVIFIFIAIYINLNTCYEVYTSLVLIAIAVFLYICFTVIGDSGPQPISVSNDTITIVVHSSERTRSRVKTWKELV